jgi:hypothetical protein
MGGFPFVSKNFHLFQRISKNFKEFQFVSISFRHWAMKKTAATAFLSVQHTPYLLKNSSLFSDSGVYKLSSSIRRWSKPPEMIGTPYLTGQARETAATAFFRCRLPDLLPTQVCNRNTSW